MAKNGLTIHPQRGLNPHLGFCPACGEENGEILLIGIHNRVYTCAYCGTQNYGANNMSKCASCKSKLDRSPFREIEENEKIPGSLCTKCENERKTMREEVARGGIYWMCKDCNSHGVIKAESEFAKEVRRKTGIQAPNPVGAEFTKEDCPACGPKRE